MGLTPAEFHALCRRVRLGYGPTVAEYRACNEEQNLILVALEAKRLGLAPARVREILSK